jgi:hypothetical protein
MSGIRPFLSIPVCGFLCLLAGCDNATDKGSEPQRQSEPGKESAVVAAKPATPATSAAPPVTAPAEKPGPAASAKPATVPAPKPVTTQGKASVEVEPAATADTELEGDPQTGPVVSDLPAETPPTPEQATQFRGFAERLIQHAETAGWSISRDEDGNIFLYPRGTAAHITR